MKRDLIVHDCAGYSFTYELANNLTGHYNVKYIYASGYGSSKGNRYENKKGLECIDLSAKPVQKSKFLRRFFNELEYARQLKIFLSGTNVNYVISANTPIIPQIILQRYCKRKNIKFTFWLQDIISIAVKSIVSKKNIFLAPFVSGLWSFLEKRALKNSDAVITISTDFDKILKDWGVPESKIFCIPNWAPIKDFPVKEKANSFSRKHGLSGTFNIVYSGTLGFKHNPDILYETAEKLESNGDIKFIIISEGIGADRLRELNAKNNLSNLILLPYQPYETVPEVLGSADLIISILEPSAGIFSVPSKVWSGFCAARTSLLVVPDNNLTAKITREISAGVIAKPNPCEISDIILDLYNNPGLLKTYGSNARKYAEDNFNIGTISQRFIKIFGNL